MNLLFDLPANYEVVREGKPNGENWIFRIKTSEGREITSVAVTQPNGSRTGPTWSYVFENIGISTVDVGSPGSFESLKDGYKAAGLSLTDVRYSIVSHGHSDHDGTIPDFITASKADLCAHESYEFLKPHKSWDIQDFSSTILKRELTRIGETKVDKSDFDKRLNRDDEYYRKRKETEVVVPLSDGTTIGDMKVIATPGHSPDQICLSIDDVIFTGDHVLPEITPHPTTKMVFKEAFYKSLPRKGMDLESLYGLGVYMQSLGVISQVESDVILLPAHRLYNRGGVNTIGPCRAKDIVEHHARRLKKLLEVIEARESSLEDLTRGIFSRGKLLGSNLMAALSEVVAHLEFLEDVGDIEVREDGMISHIVTKKHNYVTTIDQLLTSSG